MKSILLFIIITFSISSFGQSSMRRCTLLPVTDSVEGAIGFKVFEKVESELKKSNWCTYVSNSGLVSVFSRYRDNLVQYLKNPEVIKTVADKLKVGSIIRLSIKNELKGVDIEMTVYGENGEDVLFSEKTVIKSDEIDDIAQVGQNWLNHFSKTIPYDGKINGILGEQITIDVGKGYPIKVGQKIIVKRLLAKKKHPLLKKIVDWESEVIAEGNVFSISDNQALGIIKNYTSNKTLVQGDWVRLGEVEEIITSDNDSKDEKDDSPGVLGILSIALFGTSSSVDTSTPGGSNRMSGNLFGIDFRVEGWVTRQYLAALEINRSIGSLKETSGSPSKNKVNGSNGTFKIIGGYKYLPIGFFYGPQIDIYTGYANHSFDLDVSEQDGFGKNSISGLLFGTAANIPINREYRFFAQAEFIPFPTFSEDDDIYGSAKSVSAMELEIGLKYQYTSRMTVDGSIETLSRKAKFKGNFKEVSYRDNRLKVGVSFNF